MRLVTAAALAWSICTAAPWASAQSASWQREWADIASASSGSAAVDPAGAYHFVYFTNGDTGACRWFARLPDGTYINPLTGQPWPISSIQYPGYYTQTGPATNDNLSGMVRPSILFDESRAAYFAFETSWAGPIAVRKFNCVGTNTWAPAGPAVMLPQAAGYWPLIRRNPGGLLAVAWAGGHNDVETLPPGIAVSPGGWSGPWSTSVSWDYGNCIDMDAAGDIHVLSPHNSSGDYWYQKFSPTLAVRAPAVRLTDTAGANRIFSPSIAVSGDVAYAAFQIADGYRGYLDCWLWTVAAGTAVAGPTRVSDFPAGWVSTACTVSACNGRAMVSWLGAAPNQNATVYAWDLSNDIRSGGLDPGWRTTNQVGVIDPAGNIHVNARVMHWFDANGTYVLGGTRYGRLAATPVGPVIWLSATVVTRSTWWGSPITSQDAVELANVGTGTLAYTVAHAIPWLAVSPGSGTSTGEHDTLQLGWNAAGLPPGTYTGSLIVNAPGAMNTPQQIAVRLIVRSSRADFDRDGDVDQSDFGHLQACLSGEYVVQDAAACVDARLDADTDVDAEDLNLLLTCIGHDGVPTATDCLP